MSILKEVHTVAYKINRHDVFTRHGREWRAAQEAAHVGTDDVRIPAVGGGVVILPRDASVTVRRHVGERPCATA
ncbi:hypothetical protein OTB20_08655 [Streptomyces sp. H27-H1]|uniref:hypothetical protein n=1 Tax=Streptomyces sp. H27-H1 TaxID=2996461 RepID=UPI00226DF0CE|nr:hypothetical protein [Streptomyces sp. H27-H1]MCY0926276.1 hypothetical protein [Streptomyces sp. H27-H1]